MQPNINPADKNSPAYLNSMIKMGRYSLLLAVAFTAINLALVFVGKGYFLFSASVPYYGMLLAKLAAESGLGDYTLWAVAVSGVILALLLMSFLLSFRNPGWQALGMVVLILDFAGFFGICCLFGLDALDRVMDILFHGWAICALWQGFQSGKRLAKAEEKEDRKMENP